MCLGAQFTGSLLTLPAIRSGWYADLAKPAFTPPDWVFGPVWTFLFFIMAVAAWLVWKEEDREPLARPGLILFYLQLMVNVLWSALFFASGNPGWAFADIVLLWFLILVLTVLFFRVSRLAGLLFVPYLLWVLYAAALNGTIWWLNRGMG